MGKTYFTKHDLQKMQGGLRKTLADLSRHPDGTKAKGLRKVLRKKTSLAVSADRNRFGWAEEKSSRLRGGRRNVHKTARQEARKEISERPVGYDDND